MVVSADVEPEQDQPDTFWVLGQPFQRSPADAELMLARDGDPGQQNEEARNDHELTEPVGNLAEDQAEDQNGQLAKADCHGSSHRVQVSGIHILRNDPDQGGADAAQCYAPESGERGSAFASVLREAELAEDQNRPHDHGKAEDDDRDIHPDMQRRADVGMWWRASRIAEVADRVRDEAVLRPEDPGDQHLSCEVPGTQHYDDRTHPVVAISEKPDPYRLGPLPGWIGRWLD